MERISSKGVVIERFNSLPCSLRTFTIGGIVADEDDFGEKEFRDGNCRDNSCGCTFIPGEPTKEVLEKYKINEEDFYNICEELVNKLYVSSCGLCS
jgi:hypothetical protein